MKLNNRGNGPCGINEEYSSGWIPNASLSFVEYREHPLPFPLLAGSEVRVIAENGEDTSKAHAECKVVQQTLRDSACA